MKRIKLTQGKEALVDDEYFDMLSKLKWHACPKIGCVYAGTRVWNNTNKTSRILYMHRLLMKAMPGQIVDHINRNGLDNTLSNLRLATKSQNSCNSKRRKNKTGYKGVQKQTNHNSWTAIIKVETKTIYLGNFSTPQAAAEAYDKAAVRYHGPFAVTNRKNKNE